MNIHRRPTEIGPYQVQDVLSENTMTRIYRVRRLSTTREYALKTFICMRLTDAETRERFRREVVATAAVHHPNVVETVDWGYWQETTPYFVMELVDGKTLAQSLDATPLNPDLGVVWARDILMGLEAIHAADMVHRGLHPDNLLVTHAGRVKILDFGLARRSGWELWTQGGTSLGRVPYVAPEQLFDAHSVGPAADLYVLGMILYRAWAGKLPFETTDPISMLAAMTNGSLLPLDGVPAPLVQWVSRLLAPQARNRYATATETLRALDVAQQL